MVYRAWVAGQPGTCSTWAGRGVPSSRWTKSPNSFSRATSRGSNSPSRLGGMFRWKQALFPTESR